MAKINFTLGNTRALIDWLSQFIAIDNSLVIEIDPTNQKILAKSATTDMSFASYSSMSFEDASLTFIGSQFELESNSRFKLGILLSLDKFMNILSPFAKNIKSTDEISGDKNLTKLTLNVLSPENKEINGDCIYYDVANLTLKNSNLKMGFTFAESQHFVFISDTLFFDTIYKLEDPLLCDVANDALKESIDIDNIYNSDAKKDRIEFSFENDDVTGHTKIVTSDAQHNYQMGLASYEYKVNQLPPNFKVLKKYITILLKSIDTNSKSTFSFPNDITDPRQNRILIQSDNSYFCIGGINTADFDTI